MARDQVVVAVAMAVCAGKDRKTDVRVTMRRWRKESSPPR
jgi:hypothetical protein